MSIQAQVSIVETGEVHPVTFENEPEVGETLTLNIGGKDEEYVITALLPKGLPDGVPCHYGVYVKIKK